MPLHAGFLAVRFAGVRQLFLARSGSRETSDAGLVRNSHEFRYLLLGHIIWPHTMVARLAVVVLAALLLLPGPQAACGQSLPVQTNLYAWYTAGQGVTTTNGLGVAGTVNTWADQSGNGHDLSNVSGGSANAITLNLTGLNGQPGIDFATNSETVALATTSNFGLTGSPNVTVFEVVNYTSAPNSYSFIFGGHSAAGTMAMGIEAGAGDGPGDTGNITAAGGFGQDVHSTYTGPATNSFSDLLVSFRYNAGTPMNSTTGGTSLKVDGTEYFDPTHSSGFAFNLAAGRAFVGGSTDAQANGFAGDIAEIIVYNGVLSDSDENAVGYYLANKYGLTTDYTAPTVSGTAWSGATNTAWSTASNWTGSVPGATSGTASTDSLVFNTFNATNPAPVVDAGRNIQSIAFDNTSGGLTGSITLGTTTGNALLLSSGGTISTNFSVTTPQTINAPLILEGSGGTFTFTSGAGSATATLTFGGPITVGASSGATTLTLNGANTGANTISGAMSDHGGGQLALTMSSGSWVLAGANTFTGATTVNGGTLRVGNGTSGSLGNTPISISGGSLVLGAGGSIGATSIGISGGSMVVLPGGSLGNAAIALSGTGTFAPQPGSGAISVGSSASGTGGATLSLGAGTTFSMVDGAIGTFNLQQQTNFGAANTALTLGGGTLNFELSGSGADKLAVNVGAAAVSGANTIGITPIGSSLTVGGTYPLISAPAGGLSGGTYQFAGGATSKIVSAGGAIYKLSLQNTSTAVSVAVAAGPTLPVTANLYAWYDATSSW